MSKQSLSAIRPRLRGAFVALALSSAMFGAVTAAATGAHALVPPFHCKQSPQGQDCTNGGGGTGWSPPASYRLVGSGLWDWYERSDGQDATYMDAATVQAVTGSPHCEVFSRPNGGVRTISCD